METEQGMSKTLVVSLVILVLLILGGGAWYWYSNKSTPTTTPTTTTPTTPTTTTQPTTTTTDETADWKTYTSTKYGFTFKYPSTVADPKNLDIDSSPAGGDSHSFSIYIKNPDYGKTGIASSMDFDIYEPTSAEKNLTLALFVDKVTKDALQKTSTKVGGENAIKVSFVKGSIEVGSNSVVIENRDVIFVKHASYYLYIQPKSLEKSKTQDTVTLNQILSTFQFTK